MEGVNKRKIIEMDPESGFEPSIKRQRHYPDFAAIVDGMSASQNISTRADLDNDGTPDSPNGFEVDNDVIESSEEDNDDHDHQINHDGNAYNHTIAELISGAPSSFTQIYNSANGNHDVACTPSQRLAHINGMLASQNISTREDLDNDGTPHSPNRFVVDNDIVESSEEDNDDHDHQINHDGNAYNHTIAELISGAPSSFTQIYNSANGNHDVARTPSQRLAHINGMLASQNISTRADLDNDDTPDSPNRFVVDNDIVESSEEDNDDHDHQINHDGNAYNHTIAELISGAPSSFTQIYNSASGNHDVARTPSQRLAHINGMLASQNISTRADLDNDDTPHSPNRFVVDNDIVESSEEDNDDHDHQINHDGNAYNHTIAELISGAPSSFTQIYNSASGNHDVARTPSQRLAHINGMSASQNISTRADLDNDGTPDSPNGFVVDNDVIESSEEDNDDHGHQINHDGNAYNHTIAELISGAPSSFTQIYNSANGNHDVACTPSQRLAHINGMLSSQNISTREDLDNDGTPHSPNRFVVDNDIVESSEEDNDDHDHQINHDGNAYNHTIAELISGAPSSFTQIYNSANGNHDVARTPSQRLAHISANNNQSVEASEDAYVLSRKYHLPVLFFSNPRDAWEHMCKIDEQNHGLRNCTMFDYHPDLSPRMRGILLSWLMEVCALFKLQRETYYLAVDYFDRYLAVHTMVERSQLQLIGITCLFVAAKVEEIYNLNKNELEYATEGACQVSDILQHEYKVLQTLGWSITPATPINWLGVYVKSNVYEVDGTFIYPQFTRLEFIQTTQLLDLCSLHVNSIQFPYSVLAAAAVAHTVDKVTALRCSGFDWQALQICYEWMKPFFQVVVQQNQQCEFEIGYSYPNTVVYDSHDIQTHSATMAMFDRVLLLQEQISAAAEEIRSEASPTTGFMRHHYLPTPPACMGILDAGEAETHQSLQDSSTN